MNEDNKTPFVVEAEVQVFICECCSEGDVVIYTEGPVVLHVRSSLAPMTQTGRRIVRVNRDASALITSSLRRYVL